MFDTEDKSPESSRFLVEKGDGFLTIAFSGLAVGLHEVRHDFYNFTSGDGCSKIFCKDMSELWYQKGLDEECDSVEKLQCRLQKSILDISPARITCIGISSGGYAALLFGHLLNVDIVHAFGPQTFLSRELRKHYKIDDGWLGPETERLYREVPDPKFYDLKPFLLENRNTRFFIHVGVGCEIDRKYASYLGEVPGVEIIEHNTDEHSPAAYLKRTGKLKEVLQIGK